MKLKKIYQYDEIDALKHVIILSLKNCKKYNDNMNYFDQTIINANVKFALIEKISKNYKFVHINRNL